MSRTLNTGGTATAPSPETLAIVRDIGERLGGACPEGLGFVFWLFDFGDTGFSTYISNAQRADVIKALEGLMAHLQRGGGATPG